MSAAFVWLHQGRQIRMKQSRLLRLLQWNHRQKNLRNLLLKTIEPFPETIGKGENEAEKQEEPEGLKIIVATDMHYLARELTGSGERICGDGGARGWKSYQLYLADCGSVYQ